ncbi:unnamed protein product [Caenorhabditis brenneri]
MSAKDEKTKTHHNYHPVKLLGIFLIWTISLYIALVIIKNYDADLPPESTEFSRPQLVENDNICKSPECITLAHQLHNWQDISVDPCHDFYQAACGKYNEQNTVKGTRLSKATKIMLNLVTEHLEKNLPTTSKSEQTMQTFYRECQEHKKLNREKQRYQEIFQTINKIGPWPMADKNWDESSFDLNDMMSNMASLGKTNFGFFSIEPTEDFTVKISQYAFIEDVTRIGKTSSNELVETIIKNILIFNNVTIDNGIFEETDKNLTKLIQAVHKTVRLHSGKTIGLAELRKRVPSVNFERIIKSLINPTKREEIWSKIAGKVIAEEQEPLFSNAKNFETILRTTPKRTLADLIIYSFIISEVDKFVNEVGKTCAEMTHSAFPLASLRIIVRNHFDKANLEIASKMVEDVRQSFIEMIEESHWLNEDTKRNAIQKAKIMRKVVGYPKEFEIPGALDSFFETLVTSPDDSFFKLMRNVERFKTERAIDFVASSLQMLSKTDYFEANASYNLLRNLLILNIPIINDPFFDSTYPDYAKIASIGEVLGHEIGHGFDTDGRMFDENGKKRNWWTPEDSAEYDKRAQCLIHQYSNFNDPDFGKNLNGSKTIDEVVADVIGINTSWRTYRKLNLLNEPKIIGFEDYDTGKLFFRLAALNWCKPRSTHSLSEQLTKRHPTSSFRVNGIFSNTKSFAEAYNCPVGSPMNPVKKCELF